MTSILALAALGSWSYAGFLAEPSPTPTPPPASAPDRPAVDVPDDDPAEEPEDEPEEQPEASPTAPTATLPTRYRLADAGGQVWEHPDPAYLKSFVEARNRQSVQQRYYQPLGARPASCAGGRCN